jgi:hypothetical protein
MKKTLNLVIAIMLLYCSNGYSQNNYFCHVVDTNTYANATNGEQRPNVNTTCSRNSVVYNNFFRHKENYIPHANVLTNARTVKKKIKLRFMVPDPQTPTKKNFSSLDDQLLRDMIYWMNDWFANTEAPDKPLAIICGTCHIPNTKFEFELVEIKHFPGQVFTRYNYGNLINNYLIPNDTALNVFFLILIKILY